MGDTRSDAWAACPSCSRTWRSARRCSFLSSSSSRGGGGTMRALHLLCAASTPPYLTVLNRGGCTAAASRASRDRGSISSATVPSLNGRLRTSRTRSSPASCTRSCEIGGRRMYLQSASFPAASVALAVVEACSEKPPRVAQSALVWRSLASPRSVMGSRRRSAGPAGTVPSVEATASWASAGSLSASVASALTTLAPLPRRCRCRCRRCSRRRPRSRLCVARARGCARGRSAARRRHRRWSGRAADGSGARRSRPR